MRPVRLDLAGFTVFRDETTIDFAGAEFFALLGPTGSGKSTVLDAICFALYGTVPRWDHLRSVENALSPSASEARVRLVFESSGARYVATRVLRRSARGKVTTTRAGLERLPADFDLSTLDSDRPGGGELGEVLAGTPSEMTDAVAATVGMPYEQFVTCVVLPQGEFAEFLHAKPAKRQEILVNLLGLRVYQRIAERARQAAKDADSDVRAVDALLAGMADATEQSVAEATERVGQLRGLAEAVGAAVPELTAAQGLAAEAREALAELDAEGRLLAGITTPDGVAELAETAARAREAAEASLAAVTDAEQAEERAATALDAAGDPGALRRTLDRYRERDALAAEEAGLADAAAAAERRATAARGDAESAETTLTDAEAALAAARTAQTAAALRPELAVGHDCPVCARTVTELPPPLDAPHLAEARSAVAAARDHRDRADRAARELAAAATAAARQRAQAAERLAALAAELADAPEPDALTARLAGIEELRVAQSAARTGVTAARREAQRARSAADDTDRRLRTGWQRYDGARDAVSRFGPPATDRDDLAASWQELAGWAATEADARRKARADRLAAAKQAATAADAVRDKVGALLDECGVARPGDAAADAGAYELAVALAVERAEAGHRRAAERYEQAAGLRERRAGHARDNQVAKALAGHLAADRFQRWLLTEAMDLLVDGASAILRELSGGQYELAYDVGEFFVVDHHDADLRRAVRTLSGGETFQASLALALALSEQLAGLSTTATSLESIMLDEGFGTLDPGTLDTVAATLENLAARGDRMVGIVTHVAELAERIPVRFTVSKDARGAHVTREQV
ncbi:MAG TPA: SMC family ATPase [Actinocatenispora sp.]